MARFHIHVGVEDLPASIRFYNALLGTEPTVQHDDYAKWELDDPKLHFAVSTRIRATGVDHLGLQAESADELARVEQRLRRAQVPTQDQTGTTCCYARSDKHWAVDPQGIPWERFHTLEAVPTFGESAEPGNAGRSCCAPGAGDCR